ncbi:hypothetical protein SPHINGO8AM_50051 [Sphingomonas sp. 8AM]|nr:hypothetical protein SPHINGO8AM_50051 [Sphingomonas sp. 8AM]
MTYSVPEREPESILEVVAAVVAVTSIHKRFGGLASHVQLQPSYDQSPKVFLAKTERNRCLE